MATALAANVGGSLLALAAAATAGWCLISAARGKWLIQPDERVLALLALAVAAVTLVDWGLRLAFR